MAAAATPAGEVRGIWAVLYAFFDAAGGLDRALMRRQVGACAAAGCHGVACLGLATEVGKLGHAERRQVLEWVAEDTGGRLPFAVTVAEASVAAQAAFARAAAEAGASFVILQPPPVPGLPEAEYLRFFGAVADACAPLPVAIQNAAAYLGIGLSAAGLAALNRRHPNVRLLKAEGPAVEVAELIERTGGVFRVLNGRGGLELPDNLRAGCVGMVPAPECCDRQVALFEAFAAGDEAGAEAIYREILPAIAFAMQSIPHLLAYGKRLAAFRMGMAEGEVHDRAPALPATPFGIAAARRLAAALGPFPG